MKPLAMLTNSGCSSGTKKAEPMSIIVVIWTIVAFYDYDRRMKLKAARAAQGQKYVEESERRQAIAKQKRKCRKSIAYLNYRTQIRSGSFKLNAPDAPQDPCKKYKVPPIQEYFFSDE